MKNLLIKTVFFILILMLVPSLLNAHGFLGFRVGLYEEIDEMYLGVEWMHRASPRIEFNPSLEYVLITEGRFVSLNWDAHYNLVNSHTGFVEIGGGLAIMFINDEMLEEDTVDSGVNVSLTSGLVLHDRYMPYIQAKYIFNSDINNQLLIAMGLRFQLNP